LMMQLVKAGNLERALRYHDLVKASFSPQDLEETENLRWRIEALDEGMVSIRQAMEAEPGSAVRQLELGRAFTSLLRICKREERMEFHAMAIAAFQRALQLDPQIEGARYGIGCAHASEGNLGLAVVEFKAELELHPDNYSAHRDIAMIFMNWGSLDHRALFHLESALAFGPEESATLACAARLHIDPRLASRPPLEINGESIACHDMARSRRLAERALAIDPSDHVVREQCSFVFYALADFDRSIELIEGLLVDQPWRAAELNNRIAKFLEGAEIRRSSGKTSSQDVLEEAQDDQDS